MSSPKRSNPGAATATVEQDEGAPRSVDVRTTALALFLGWLVPGMGHVVLRRARRGLLFGVLILGSFGLGLANDGRLALKSEREAILSSLQVVANLGVGPLDALARIRVYGSAAYTLPGDATDPKHDDRLGIFRDRSRSIRSVYGTAYLWTAGLMNLLLLMDVFDISQGRKR